MSKAKLSILTIFLSIFFCKSLLAESRCTSTSIETTLRSKNINLEKQINSITFLIEKSGFPQLPLELIFQVDVTDSEQVKRRLLEVRKLTTVDSVQKTRDYEALLRCATEAKEQSEIAEYAKRAADLNILKVKFFEFPEDKQRVLVENYISQRSLSNDRATVQKEVQKTEAALVKAQNQLNQSSETLDDSGGTSKDEDLAVAKTTLQQYLADYATEHLEFLKLIEEKKASLDKIKAEVGSLVQREQGDNANVAELLPLSNLIWEQTVDFISDLFKGLNVGTQIDLPEPLEPQNKFSDEDAKDYSTYIKSYADAKRGRLDQTQKRTEIVNDLRFQAFQVLTEAGQLRSRLFSSCDRTSNCNGHRSLNAKNLADFAREIEIVPIKVQAGSVAKVLEFKGKLSAGVDGWIDLFQQIVALFILLAIPLILLRTLNWFNAKLDSTRKSILSRSMMDFRKRTSIALWISKINPFIPASGMAIGIWTARQLIETTDIRELSQFLFYFQLYFIYRIVRLLVQILLEILFSSESVGDLREQRQKAESSAKRISRLIFIEYAFLFLVETTARRALVYGLASEIIFYFNLVFIFWEAYRWNQQILDASKLRFPKFAEQLDKLLASKILVFLSGPFLILAVGLRDLSYFVYSYLIRLDFFKKIHSEIFRRRIEADAEEETKNAPSESYLKQFDYYLPADKTILVTRQASATENTVDTINSWLIGRATEDLIIIVGNRGMGKTTVLNSIAKSFSGEIKVVRPSPKTIEVAAFFKFLSSAFDSEIDSIDSFVRMESELKEKIVVLVDDVQNLFLGEISGFEIYKTFVEILSLKTKNIFWCLSVNSRSWSYLKGALGQEHLYGKVFELTPWRDFEIQELILKRHELTGFSRQFDKSIKAYGASGDALGQQAETQFFRLLWGQSRGNPRSALMYWISAISQTGSDKIVVGVPSFVSSSLVSSMSDDSLFLLASIARHESLTQTEMHSVTSIPNTVIRKCMKEALDKNLVWSDSSGRYRISSRAQYVIDYFLIGKNFLYE
ncbi:MAG: ATP-binding protein [Bdellovibrionales bacterium]|nr:ATP-binding protein [Bdellovibrionales bacterium]